MRLGDAVQAKEQEQARNQAAVKIFENIRNWRNVPETAGRRWVWELIQNAVDSTAKSKNEVDVSVTLTDDLLTFEHSGDPFFLENLAALILGGTSKPFEAQPNVGEFGTGFLVTHVLSCRVDVEGHAIYDETFQNFKFVLDRGDDREAIRDNIKRCFDQLNEPYIDTDSSVPSARFRYPLTGETERQAAKLGLQQLENLLPYVFGFASRLRSVSVHLHDKEKRWQRASACTTVSEDEWRIKHIKIDGHDQENASSTFLMIIQGHDDDSTACAVLARPIGSEQLVIIPPSDTTPKIFRTYPLFETARLRLPVVINADFVVDEKRREIYLKAEERDETKRNRQKVSDALTRLPRLVLHGIQQGWSNVHLLANLRPQDQETEVAWEWWKAELKKTAERLSKQPLVVLTNDDLVPAIGSDSQVMYPVFPLSMLDSSINEVNFEQVWSLVRRVFWNVPHQNVARDWQNIVWDWQALGIRIPSVYTVKRLVSDAQSKRSLSSLSDWLGGTEDGALKWLRDLLSVIAEYSDHHGGFSQELLQGILPNQKGILRSPRELARDKGIDERLKNIAEDLGQPLRDGLLHEGLMENAESDRSTRLLKEYVHAEKTEEEGVEALVAQLQKDMPPDSPRSPNDKALKASIKLLAWLAEHPEQYSKQARRISLLTQAGRTQIPAEEPIVLLPPSEWDPTAAPYAKVFPETRLLSETYVETLEDSETTRKLFAALVEWNIAYKDLLASSQPLLDERYVPALSVNPLPDGKHKVTDIKCSTIPFLP